MLYSKKVTSSSHSQKAFKEIMSPFIAGINKRNVWLIEWMLLCHRDQVNQASASTSFITTWNRGYIERQEAITGNMLLSQTCQSELLLHLEK